MILFVWLFNGCGSDTSKPAIIKHSTEYKIIYQPISFEHSHLATITNLSNDTKEMIVVQEWGFDIIASDTSDIFLLSIGTGLEEKVSIFTIDLAEFDGDSNQYLIPAPTLSLSTLFFNRTQLIDSTGKAITAKDILSHPIESPDLIAEFIYLLYFKYLAIKYPNTLDSYSHDAVSRTDTDWYSQVVINYVHEDEINSFIEYISLGIDGVSHLIDLDNNTIKLVLKQLLSSCE